MRSSPSMRRAAAALASTWRMTKSITVASRTASSDVEAAIRIQFLNRSGSTSLGARCRILRDTKRPMIRWASAERPIIAKPRLRPRVMTPSTQVVTMTTLSPAANPARPRRKIPVANRDEDGDERPPAHGDPAHHAKQREQQAGGCHDCDVLHVAMGRSDEDPQRRQQRRHHGCHGEHSAQHALSPGLGRPRRRVRGGDRRVPAGRGRQLRRHHPLLRTCEREAIKDDVSTDLAGTRRDPNQSREGETAWPARPHRGAGTLQGPELEAACGRAPAGRSAPDRATRSG